MKQTSFLTALLFTFTLPAFVSAANSQLTTGRDGDVRFAHGGVGKGGMKAVKAVKDDYDVQLIFTDSSDRYLADVEVSIEEVDGDRVFAIQTKGPVLLVDLPDGRYHATANLPGRSKAKQTFRSRGNDRTQIIMELSRKP